MLKVKWLPLSYGIHLIKHLCPKFQIYYIIPSITLLGDALSVLANKY